MSTQDMNGEFDQSLTLITVCLARKIQWRIQPSGCPDVFSFAESNKYFLVSPLVTRDEQKTTAPEFYILPDGSLFFQDERLEVVAPCEDVDNLRMFTVIQDLLIRMRWFAKKAQMSGIASISSHLPESARMVPPARPRFPDTALGGNPEKVSIQDYIAFNAISPDVLRRACEPLSDFSVPVYAELLLGAIDAQIEGDHRKAILYSAIAVEAMTGTVLDQHYERALRERKDDNQIRVRVVPLPRGESKLRDPVFEFISASTSGDFSARRLDVLPLYLLGRSLLVDLPTVYRDCVKLFRTRNKIAHLGQPNRDDEKLLSLNRSGGIAALETACQVFEWFGVGGEYIVPRGLVRLSDLSYLRFGQ